MRYRFPGAAFLLLFLSSVTFADIPQPPQCRTCEPGEPCDPLGEGKEAIETYTGEATIHFGWVGDKYNFLYISDSQNEYKPGPHEAFGRKRDLSFLGKFYNQQGEGHDLNLISEEFGETAGHFTCDEFTMNPFTGPEIGYTWKTVGIMDKAPRAPVIFPETYKYEYQFETYSTVKNVEKSVHPQYGEHVSALTIEGNGTVYMRPKSQATPFFQMVASTVSATGAGWRTFTTQDGLPMAEITSVKEDLAGNIWAGTANGVFEFDGTWISHSDGKGPGTRRVCGLDKAPTGTIWVGTTDGLFRWDRVQWKHYAAVAMDPKHREGLACAPNGDVWVAGADRRIYRLQQEDWNSFSSSDGLPDVLCTVLTFDREGALWAGFDQGYVARYDDNGWRVWSENDGLARHVAPEKVTSIQVDSENTVWVSTWSGLFRFDGTVWIEYGADLPQTHGWGGIWCIALDAYDRVWCSTADRGVFYFNEQEWRQVHDENSIVALMADARGAVWMGSRGGDLYRIYQSWEDAVAAIGLPPVSQVAAGIDGDIWLATGFPDGDAKRGLLHVSRRGLPQVFTANRRDLPTNEIRDIKVSPDGTAWFATACGLLKHENGEFVPCSYEAGEDIELPDRWSYRADPEDRGLAERWYLPEYDVSAWKDRVFWARLIHDNVAWLRTDIPIPQDYEGWDLLFWSDEVSDECDFFFNGERIEQINARDIPTRSDRLFLIPGKLVRPGSDNTICIRISLKGESGGLHGGRLTPIRQYGESLDLQLLSVDEKGTVWALEGDGAVARFDGGSWSETPMAEVRPGDSRNLCLSSDNNGMLWTGASDGLSLTPTDAETSQKLEQLTPSLPESVKNDEIVSICSDGKDYLWVTAQSQLARLDGTDWTCFEWPEDIGRINCATAGKNGVLWVGTEGAGVYAFDGKYWSSFDSGDGLGSMNILDLASDGQERVWAVCDQGTVSVHRFDRTGPQINLVSPVKTVEYPGQVVFSWEGRDRWEQTPPHHIKYQWRLDGGAWSAPANEFHAFYPRITPGQHVFEVRGIDRDLNSSVRTWEFATMTPVWLQSWFLALMGGVFVALSLAISFAWIRHRQLQAAYAQVATGKKELEKANVQLQELDSLKTDFLSNVSHELRTPLTSIKGSADNLLDGIIGEMTDEQREYLGLISMSTDRLVRLINDLLDLSRIESGVVKMVREPVPLADLFEQTIDGLQALASDRTLTFDRGSEDGSLVAFADPDRISQVLTNLVGNAIKFTPPNGDIKVVLRRADTSFVRVSVADTGPGIPEDEHQRIFDRFHQARNRVKQENRGTGLGLSIAKGIVEAHGGSIGVISEPGGGSTFWFTLPLTSHDGKEPEHL